MRIYSGGATQLGVDKVKAGFFNATTAYLPYEEAYYGAVALLMAMDGKPVNGYIDEALLPKVVDSTGTIRPNVQYDVSYLLAAGALPRYDSTFGVSGAALRAHAGRDRLPPGRC